MQSRIIYNHYVKDQVEGESFVNDHIFSYMFSGTHEIWAGNQSYSFKAGDYRFFRRNQLTKYVKRPVHETFRSVAVHISQDTLQEIGKEYGITANGLYTGNNIELLQPNQYLEAYFTSLLPYINKTQVDNDKIVALKTRELVVILLETNPKLREALFDFSDPGKLDLEAFMNSHYRYNVSLDRFAFLTGRSLSTFKRDFMRIYTITPGRWLVRKRLEEANFLIEQKKMTPSEIYLDLGFEDLSHFSFAYKKAFGKPPSGIQMHT